MSEHGFSRGDGVHLGERLSVYLLRTLERKLFYYSFFCFILLEVRLDWQPFGKKTRLLSLGWGINRNKILFPAFLGCKKNIFISACAPRKHVFHSSLPEWSRQSINTRRDYDWYVLRLGLRNSDFSFFLLAIEQQHAGFLPRSNFRHQSVHRMPVYFFVFLKDHCDFCGNNAGRRDNRRRCL